ncbi:hypothetical protein FD754_010374 [Muntiacus muntjak]|uniref:Uncharacterized protein n=1 Tax=Muntiacus muntjak TaxID=9888 RepID=A0A5N3WZC0_MUNMU|nr:hypothetical protein FD754_010374 [Muntiacus muntjak]
MSDSVRPHRRQPTRLCHPWDSPGKNTGVGCHFLLQCMKVKSESEVAQSCLTLRDPMDCSPPGSSLHGIFQARVLEWGAIAFSGICAYLFSILRILLVTDDFLYSKYRFSLNIIILVLLYLRKSGKKKECYKYILS